MAAIGLRTDFAPLAAFLSAPAVSALCGRAPFFFHLLS